MKHLLILVFSAVALSSAQALAESSESEETFDVDTISCWDLGDMDTENRVSALLLVYGYVAGQRNEPTQSGPDIEAVLEQTGELCSSNPDMYISEAMERRMR